MRRDLRFSLIGLAFLGSLAGCGRGFLFMEEREPWRHEAEVQCLKSGAVKESAARVRISPIDGPGICGADFPLQVTALGEGPAMAFADDPRPPGSIPKAGVSQPRWPVSQPSPPPAAVYAPAPVYREPVLTPGEPLSLRAPGIADLIEADAVRSYPSGRPDSSVVRSYPPDSPTYNAPRGSSIEQSSLGPPPAYPRAAPPAPQTLPALGPARGTITGSIRPVEVKPNATLACPIVSALDQWITASVQPAAMRWFGQPVTEIRQISAYSCRGMNGQVGAKISEHAFGNALDIAGFTLADGRKVVVRTAWNGAPEEQGFLHDIQGAACQQFNTVLAPGSNQFHYDHIHVDLMRRASRQTICQPAAVPGEVAAARAAQKKGYARRADPTAITGSVTRKPKLADAPYEDDDHQWAKTAAPAGQAESRPQERN